MSRWKKKRRKKRKRKKGIITATGTDRGGKRKKGDDYSSSGLAWLWLWFPVLLFFLPLPCYASWFPSSPSPFFPPFLSPKPENCLSALCRRAKKSVMLGLLLSVGVFD